MINENGINMNPGDRKGNSVTRMAVLDCFVVTRSNILNIKGNEEATGIECVRGKKMKEQTRRSV